MKTFFWQLIVSQIKRLSDTKYPEERTLLLVSFVQKLQLKQRDKC